MGVQPPDPFGFNNVNLFGSANQPAAAAGVAAGAPVEGQPVPEEAYNGGSRVPVGAFVLIGLGVLFLLEPVWLVPLRLDSEDSGPCILIAIGIARADEANGKGMVRRTS